MKILGQICALTLAGVLGFGTMVQAQEQAVPQAADLSPEDVSQGLLVSFVNAMIIVEKVRGAYLDEINKAEDEERVNSLIAEADRVAIESVEKVKGITAGEYIAIARMLPDSPELQSRIAARVTELREAQRVQIVPPKQPTEEAKE